jgi:peptide/nickel transport system substrate-binding protein
MKRFRWQLLIIFLTGIVIGILLLTEQPNIRTMISAPSTGGTYTEALVGSLQRLNPVLDFYNTVDRDIDRLLFSSLIKFDDRGIPYGDLAAEWGISQDGTIYNFTLRSNALWSDGMPVTAKDVVFTIDLLKNGGDVIPRDIQAFWQNVTVFAGSDTSFQFILPEAYAPFLDSLSFGILPSHLLSGVTIDTLINHPFNLQPIGSGPYIFDRLLTENGQIQGVVLVANSKYYIRRPFIEEIDFRYYPDDQSALTAYQEGKVLGINQISPELIDAALKQPGLALYSGREPVLSMILFNLNDPAVAFFQDLQVRKALMIGLDRQGMVNQLFQGQAIIADGPIFPGTWAYYEGLKRVGFDMETAKNLLIEDGYVISNEADSLRAKNGTAIVFTLLYPDDEKHLEIAQFIQKNWENLDLRVDLEAVPYDQLVNERLAQHQYQAALVDFNFTRTPDPDPYPFWDQAQITGGQNYSQWDNRLASEYLEDARVSVDLAERTKLYRNFQVIFSRESPALPLFYPVYTFGVSTQIQGIRMGPLLDTSDRFATILDWYLLANKPEQMDITPTGQ